MASDIRAGGALGYEGERTLVNFVKFVLVGVANTALGYAQFALFYLLLGSHQLAITLATACGVMFNFHSTGRLVFRSRRLSTSCPLWLATRRSGSLISCCWTSLTALAISPLAGQILALPLLVPLSYAINRYLVFGRPR
ncbi:putative flippase GtrA [Bradyrhizobium sp. i1.8.4]|uniref:GtrA family protein n=1 Tax=unclassified Bradyrhizobium TaxID=2631580 RepID=UPI003D1C3867